MIDPASVGTDRPVSNYVDGDWEVGEGDERPAVLNPATGETLATVPFSSAEQVERTVTQANEAFESWRTEPVEARIQPLFAFKQLLEDNQEDLAELLVMEHGKTFDEAMGELRRGIENVEVAVGIPSMMQSGTLPDAAPNIDESAVRQPLGVFTAITPFNFPGMIPLWFLPYAVATGNAFILKPSEVDPLTAEAMFKLVDEAGFPDGVVNLLHGGPDTVNELITHDDVVGASFVGSTPVARHVYETAAANGKRVQAQGGAKNHIIVAESADLEFAVDQTVSSAFANAGQRCLANPIAVVEDAIYDEFADAITAAVEEMTVGYGLDPDVDMSALVSAEHERTVREYVETGIEEDATLLVDGRDETVAEYDGNFLGPTVFGDVTPEMTIAREEIFGPVLGLIRVADFDEALSVLNASRFGNAASLFTGDGGEANRFKHEAEAGNLGVNVGTAAPMAFFHFGGQGDSFFGDLHAQGEDMIHFYTDKTIFIERWPDQ